MLHASLLLLVLATRPAGIQQLTLELRVFNGAEEVTAETRLTVYRAGERAEAVGKIASQAGVPSVTLPQGFYDVQAIREKDGRVLSIRWAQRLVLMPYPDEPGRHLEVINFANDFGALQVRTKDARGVPNVALFASGARDKEIARRIPGDDYALFVAPAASYDVLVRGAAKPQWHGDIEIPPDRTRLWIVP